jgi:hypothetical protein
LFYDIFIDMKIIITEEQHKELIDTYKRRMFEIMNEALLMIADDGAFYGGIDFCYHYPTFEGFMEDMVGEIIRNYQYHIQDDKYKPLKYDVGDFIYDVVGFENFINILLDAHGDEIREFYDLNTKDC